MKKKYIRKVHIDGKQWMWYVPNSGEVVIFSPEKKRYVVRMTAYLDYKYQYDHEMSVTPFGVKKYIQNKIMISLS